MPPCGIRLLIAAALTALVEPSASQAQSLGSSRGAALGGYTAVGSGISALSWNPAGLTGLGGWQFQLTNGLTTEGGSSAGGVVLHSIAAARLFPGGHAVGASVSPGRELEFVMPATLTILDPEGNPLTARYDRTIRYRHEGSVGYAFRFPAEVSAGIALKKFSTSISDTKYALDSLDAIQTTTEEFTDDVWTVTLGGRMDFSEAWSLAFGLGNIVSLGGKSLPDDVAMYGLEPGSTAFLGAAYRSREDFTVSADIDSRENLRAGVEWVPVPWGSVRSGLYARDLSSFTLDAGAAGIGLHLPPLDLDLSYIAFTSTSLRTGTVSSRELAAAELTEIDYTPFTRDRLLLTATVSLSTYREALARIEYVELLGEVYPASAHTYAFRPLGRARVRNVSEKPIDARVSFYMEDLMKGPTESRPLRIHPNELAEIPFYAVFSDDMEEVRNLSVFDGTVYVQAEIAPEYEDRYQMRVLVRGRNDWDGDVLSLRAFVTPSEPEVVAFSRDALYRNRESLDSLPSHRSQVGKARLIFEELGRNITYVSDPSASRDYVQYPLETLALHGGDCDDLAVAYSSLLLSVGIGAAFVEVMPPETPGEGHVYVLLDTGLPAADAPELTTNPKRYILRQSDRGGTTVWIPVETTIAGGDFEAAWSAGAERYYREAELEFGLLRGWMRVADINSEF